MPIELATFQAILEKGILLNPDLYDDVANNTRVDKVSNALLEDFAVSIPKSRTPGNPKPSKSACIELELRMKFRRRTQRRMNMDTALNAYANPHSVL